MSAEAKSLERSTPDTDPDGVSGRVPRDRLGSGECEAEPETLTDSSLLRPE
jgi:hypothetical protein